MEGENDYNLRVRQWLASIQPQVTSQLRRALGQPLPAGTDLIDITLHDLLDGFPLKGFFMSRSANQHGSFDFIDVPMLPSDDLQSGTLGNDYIGLSEAVSLQIFPWLADCWREASGEKGRIPGYACRHDDIESYDLQKREWIDDSEKWS